MQNAINTLKSRKTIPNSAAAETRLLRAVVFGVASLLILSGCVALAARYFPDSWPQAILFGTPIPRYNVSAAFVASGVALIAASRRWTLVTVSATIPVLVIGGARLTEYLTGLDLRNDDFLWITRHNAGAPFPVGLTLAVAFAFPIVGLHLMLSAIPRPHRACVAAMELLGFIVFAFGAAGMTGQIEGASFAFGWGSYTRMSLLTAAGLIALGIGLTALTWDRREQRVARVPLWMPAAVCFVVFLLDIAIPRGVAIGIVYVPLVFCGLWFKRAQAAFAFAVLATLLAAVALSAKAPSDVESLIVIANRVISIGMVWLVATLVYFARRSDDASRQSDLRLRAVVDSAVDGLINITERGVIESFNPACERIFGYAAAEVIGRNIKMLMPEPDHSAHDGYIGRYVATGEALVNRATGREVRARRKDGSVFPMDLALGEFRMADGLHFCGIVRDVTARKRGEETVERLAAIVASSDDAILSKTADGIVTSWNAGAERLFGYRAAEAIGQHIRLIVPAERWAEEDRIIAQIRDDKAIMHYETVGIAKDGRRIDISASISPMHDKAGRVIGAAKVARDITARKRHEAELARHVEALERSNKELDDFAYIASHDLKEPLRGLFNNAKFLRDDYATKLDEAGVGRLQRLGYLTQRMEQLVNDLLYYSRLGRQDLAIQPADLNAVIRDIEMMSETVLKERDAAIVIPRLLPRISCDKTRIAEVFRNLITNAVKYNNSPVKRIEIGYLDEMKTKDGVATQVFYVKDNGIGIEEEFFEDIFRIFKRLNAEDDDKKGTGVGLTFVRKIVERHGGRIWLDSVPGRGTTFYFTIAQGVAYDAAA